MKNGNRVRSTFWLALFSLFGSTFAATAPYHVIKRIPIPGGSDWDYITADTDGRRLYVPNGTQVAVLDLDSGAFVGKISGLEDTHGVAVAREFGRGFVDSTDPGSVTIFDIKTLAVIDKVRVGNDPNGIIYDAKLKRIFTADRGSKRLTAIDAKTGKVLGAVDNLDGRTEHLAADDAGHIFLNIQDKGHTLKIDAVSMKILEDWTVLPVCGLPSSMDIDRAHNRLFIGCRGGAVAQPPGTSRLAVVDTTTGKIVASQPIGPGVDALEFDAKTGLIYVATGGGEGTLSIFHENSPDKYTLLQNVKTLPGARTMALDHRSGTVYLPVADFDPRPDPTPEKPNPRAPALPGTFSVLVVGR